MKRYSILFLFALLIGGGSAMAQRKSVAILETYCADGNIGNAYLLMIGSNIETGIIKNPGYVAYNRAQVRQVMKEHKFERSGLVKDEEIRRLGQMAGVDYVLASEAALVDNQLFVTAKVLNVESGQYEMSDNELMDYNPSAIQSGCQNLAAKLLGGGSTPQQVRAQSTNPVSNSNYQATNVSGRNVGLPQPNNDIAVKEGLLAYWNFDKENANDATDNGYDGNLLGSPRFINETPNGYGKALMLQAAREQKMVVPFNIIPATFSICFWVKDFGTGFFFAEPSGRGGYYGWGFGVSPDGTMIITNGNDLGFEYNARTIQASGWHHIVLSKQNNMYRLYIDGNKVDEQNWHLSYHSSKLIVGGSLSPGRGAVPAMSFKIDNFRLYSRILTIREVREIYESEK